MIKLILFMVCLTRNIANAEEAPVTTPTPIPPVAQSPFQNRLSDGYTLSGGKSRLNIVYVNGKVESGASTSSIKILDFALNYTGVHLDIEYGITSLTSAKLGIASTLNDSTSVDYTKPAETSGYTDDTFERKGLAEPTLSIHHILKESDSLKVLFNADVSPSSGERKASEKNVVGNELIGGNKFSFGLNLVKALPKFEVTTNIETTNYDTRLSKSSTDSSKTTGGNETAIGLGFNFLLNEDFIIGLAFENTTTSSSTDKTKSDGSETKTDPMASRLTIVSAKVNLDKDITLLAEFVSGAGDSYSSKSGTTTINMETATTSGFLIGIITYF